MENINTKNMKRLTFLKGFLLGVGGLSLFYYLILLAVTKDFGHPIEQFELYQPWTSILIIGFGVQTGLYYLLRRGFSLKFNQKRGTKAAAGAGGAMSGVSMTACCAHHLADAAPVLGLTGAAFVLTEYQKELLLFGVMANFFAVAYLLWLMTGKKHPRELLNFALGNKRAGFMNSKMFIVIVAGVVIFSALVGVRSIRRNFEAEVFRTLAQTTAQPQESYLVGQMKSVGVVEVEVTPLKLEPGQKMVFELVLDTHSVELAYDYLKIVTARDEKGNDYGVLNWSGGKGGHHLRGEIEMEELLLDAQTITMRIEGIDNQNTEFSWRLRER